MCICITLIAKQIFHKLFDHLCAHIFVFPALQQWDIKKYPHFHTTILYPESFTVTPFQRYPVLPPYLWSLLSITFHMIEIYLTCPYYLSILFNLSISPFITSSGILSLHFPLQFYMHLESPFQLFALHLYREAALIGTLSSYPYTLPEVFLYISFH